MFLRVIGKPTAEQRRAPQKLIASYNPSTGIHTVECDVDIVTLGIALSVIKREFEECLAGLEPGIAERIRKVTEEAVMHEKY